MSAMRKLARDVSRNVSYRKSGTNDYFQHVFAELWNGKRKKKPRKPIEGR